MKQLLARSGNEATELTPRGAPAFEAAHSSCVLTNMLTKYRPGLRSYGTRAVGDTTVKVHFGKSQHPQPTLASRTEAAVWSLVLLLPPCVSWAMHLIGQLKLTSGVCMAGPRGVGGAVASRASQPRELPSLMAWEGLVTGLSRARTGSPLPAGTVSHGSPLLNPLLQMSLNVHLSPLGPVASWVLGGRPGEGPAAQENC